MCTLRGLREDDAAPELCVAEEEAAAPVDPASVTGFTIAPIAGRVSPPPGAKVGLLKSPPETEKSSGGHWDCPGGSATVWELGWDLCCVVTFLLDS